MMDDTSRELSALYYDPSNPPIIGQKRKHLPKKIEFPKKMEWTIVTREGLGNFLEDESLKGVDWRVLMTIIGNVEFENIITPNQTQLAKKLKISQGALSRSLKKLVEARAIIPIQKQRVQTQYRLNPSIGFKIASVDYRQLIDDWDMDLMRYLSSKKPEKPLEEALPH